MGNESLVTGMAHRTFPCYLVNYTLKLEKM
jgi:hypothetical protein